MKRYIYRKIMMLGFLSACLLVVGCSKDPVVGGGDDGTVQIDLSTAIDDTPAATDVAATASTSTDPATTPMYITKAPNTATNFPVDASGAVSNIGLFFMQGDGATPYAAGSDNMLGELTGRPGPVYTWRFQYRNSSSWMSNLSFYVGETVRLCGYYPRTVSGVGATSVPFDLTTAAEQSNQTDVLCAGSQTLAVSNGDANKSVSLVFGHLYALLEFQVKKSCSAPAVFTRVDVMNKSGKTWVTGKGTFDPRTGAIATATAGTVQVNCSVTLSTDSYATIQVLVPPFGGAYADDDVEVQFYDSGAARPLKFLIKGSYLSTVAGGRGLTAGLKYSYKLLYDNTATGSITLLPWGNGGDSGIVGGAPPAKMFYGDAANNGGVVTFLPGSTTSSYNSWTSVADGNSGTYHNTTASEVYTNEKPFFKLLVAPEDENGGGAVTHAEAMARCKSKTTDDGGWRLPRLSELKLILNNKASIESTPGFIEFPNFTIYWSATEVDAGAVWSMNFISLVENTNPKTHQNRARCVKELPLPPYVNMYYGDAANNGSNTQSLYGSTIASHNVYTGTVADGTNGTYRADEYSVYSHWREFPYSELQVAMEDEQWVPWYAAMSECSGKTTDGGGWRLPRMSELQLIYNNRGALERTPGFIPLNTTYDYWSGTECSSTESFALRNYGSYIAGKYVNSAVRCVREL